MAHEGVQDVGEGGIEEFELLVQNTAHVDVLVHHERVGAHVVELHGGVQRAVPPVEVVEEVYGRGNASEEVEEQVGEHNHIGLDADDRAAPSYVWFDDVFAEERALDVWVVDGDEDGGFELLGGWVVELFEVGEGLFGEFLDIWVASCEQLGWVVAMEG